MGEATGGLPGELCVGSPVPGKQPQLHVIGAYCLSSGGCIHQLPRPRSGRGRWPAERCTARPSQAAPGFPPAFAQEPAPLQSGLFREPQVLTGPQARGAKSGVPARIRAAAAPSWPMGKVQLSASGGSPVCGRPSTCPRPPELPDLFGPSHDRPGLGARGLDWSQAASRALHTPWDPGDLLLSRRGN